MSFQKDFKWGAATASYQIEGGAYDDGKGLSVWDMFCKWDGKIFSGNSGDTTCDSYNRLDEDLALIKELGLNAYRFSLSWSRIIPDGIGEVNMAGIEYYRKLIMGLKEINVEPYVTLFHWDLPYELHKKGGWLNRECTEWFVYYTNVVMEHLGDLVDNWITFNEPEVFVGHGYYDGEHAPGLKMNPYDVITITHNVLLSHGLSVRAIKVRYPNAMVGMAPTGPVGIPLTDSDEDTEAARYMMFDEHTSGGTNGEFYYFSYALFCDPIFLSKYPDWVYKKFALGLPDTLEDDLKIISTDTDFLGVNIYNGKTWTVDEDKKPKSIWKKEGYQVTGISWPVTEKALYYGPKFLYERYGKPLYITENGTSMREWQSSDGKIYDHCRINFLERYISELKKAVEDDIPVLGYFCWTLMDNFEWAEGFKERFGLIFVNFETKERTPKESYYWYKELIETNGNDL